MVRSALSITWCIGCCLCTKRTLQELVSDVVEQVVSFGPSGENFVMISALCTILMLADEPVAVGGHGQVWFRLCLGIAH